MRRLHHWVMGLAVLGATPGIVVAAAPFPLFGSKDSSQERGPSTNPAELRSRNQATADQIAAKLKAAQLEGYNIQVQYKDGVAKLTGFIADEKQRALAEKLTSRVSGVNSVENHLRPMNGPSQTQSAARNPADDDANRKKLPVPPSVALFNLKRESKSDEAPQPPPRSAIQPVAATSQTPQLLPTHPENNRATQSSRSVELTPHRHSDSGGTTTENQLVADEIAAALKQAQLTSYDISIQYHDGVATLVGSVADREQKHRAAQIASGVPGVVQVQNMLATKSVQQAAGAQPMPIISPQAARQSRPYAIAVPVSNRSMPAAFMQPPPNGQPPMPGTGPVPPAGLPMPGTPGPGGYGPAVPPPPSYGHPGQGAAHTVYDMPHLPNYAWPSYAQYPNSAQISYPMEYSASAWPYIGPFYPYPQIPLGWRKVQLEWDDGYWNLNFNPRTDRWFWFVNPKYW